MQPNNSTRDSHVPGAAKAGFSDLTFIIFMASLTSIVAFATDIMLPALLHIGAEYQISDPNDVQYVLVLFMIGFGVSQLLFGPITDTYGRKPTLIIAIALFSITSFYAIFAPNFTLVLLSRLVQGIAAGAVRSAVNGAIRDCYSGSDMARVMSHIFAAFMIAPIAAPLIGQAIITFHSWHWVFSFLGVGAMALTFWSAISFKETHELAARRPLTISHVGGAFREILTSRRAVGYMLISCLMTGVLFTFVFTVAQVFGEYFGLGDQFVFVFAPIALSLTISSITNARLVRTLPMRLLVHTGLTAFFLVAVIFFTSVSLFDIPLWFGCLIIMASVGAFGFINNNAVSIAMEPLGHIAGSASSLISTVSITGGAIIGGLVGQLYNDTIIPMAISYLLLGCFMVIIALWTERGKLTLK